MAVSELQVQTALKALIDPNTHKDYVATKSVKNIRIDGGAVSVDIVLGYPAESQLAVGVSVSRARAALTDPEFIRAAQPSSSRNARRKGAGGLSYDQQQQQQQ